MDSLAVKNVTFEARPGQMVAIIGSPGSGKTTIANLMSRFYDATSGNISIDSINIRNVTLKSLRKGIGIVQQDIFLFSDTIKANIAYGNPDSRPEDIIRASKLAQLDSFVSTLPEGYDTWIGERGITLSGGQRQRLSIARTILLDPPILILDDSTSSVDAQTEDQLNQGLAELLKERTTFVIANRLKTVNKASLILVMDNGEIAERGTHEHLLSVNGLYKKLHDLQMMPNEEPSQSSGNGRQA
jgi:ABC-type multidrug transport system fused ATPase/permease subunit